LEPQAAPLSAPRDEIAELRARVARSRPKTSRSRGWQALAAAIVLVVGGALVWRAEIVALWPPSLRLYAQLGLAPEAALRPVLILRGVTYANEREGNDTLLVVSGEVANPGPETRKLPPIRVALRDRQQNVLRSWNVELPVTELAPGASTSFTSRLRSPPAEAKDLEVSLQPYPGS
jgi:hypothetical protein